jgi:predicted nucleic acid-binding protein
MKIALDTNAYTSFCKGDSVLKTILDKAETVIVPLIVLAELRAGFACGNRQNKNEKNLELFCPNNYNDTNPFFS